MSRMHQKVFAFALAAALLFSQLGIAAAADDVPASSGQSGASRLEANETVEIWRAPQSSDTAGTSSEALGDEEISSAVSDAENADGPQESAEESFGVADEPPTADDEPQESASAQDDTDAPAEPAPCICPADASGLLLHQPGCAEYAMSDALGELYRLAKELPAPGAVTPGDEPLALLIEEITARYMALSAFDTAIFDHSLYMVRLLEAAAALNRTDSANEQGAGEQSEGDIDAEGGIITYAFLKQALAEAENGDVIELGESFPADSLKEAIVFDREGASVTIDLNSRNISAADFAAIVITAGELRLDGRGTVSARNSGGAAIELVSGRLFIQNASVHNSAPDGCAVSGEFARPEGSVVSSSSDAAGADSTTTAEYIFDRAHKYITVSETADVSDAFEVYIEGWSYSEAERFPTVWYDDDNDVTAKTVFAYSADSGGEYLSRAEFWEQNRTSSGRLKAGEYYVKAVYADATYGHLAEAKASFSVLPKPVFATRGTLAAEDKIYDADSGAIVSGQPQINGLLEGDAVTITASGAHFATSGAGAGIAILFSEMSLGGRDSGSYYLTDNEIRELTGNIKQAHGVLDPAYLRSIDEINSMHIVTNIFPTVGDIELPEGWTATEPPEKRLSVSEDDGVVAVGLKYVSNDPNYSDVLLPAHKVKASTVSLNMNDSIAARTAIKGDLLTVYGAEIQVIGAPIDGLDRGGYSDMEWRCVRSGVVNVDTYDINAYSTALTLKCTGGGVEVIELAYSGSDAPIGCFAVKVMGDTEQRNSIADLVEMAGRLVVSDPPKPSETEAANVIAEAVRELSDRRKASLSAGDIRTFESMLQRAFGSRLSAGLQISKAANKAVAPVSVNVVGAALASGVDSGVVTVSLTAQPPDGNHEMLLDLGISVNGVETELQSPLFFEITLPERVDMSTLAIRHVKDDGSGSPVSFEYEGHTAHFSLGSFSRLEFTRSVTGSGTGTERKAVNMQDQQQFWQQTSERIASAPAGAAIGVNAGRFDRMPVDIMRLIKEREVSVVIERDNGEAIKIDGKGLAITPEENRIFYPLDTLAELLKTAYPDVGEETASESAPAQPELKIPQDSSAAAAQPDGTDGSRTVLYMAAACFVLLLLIALVLLIALLKGDGKDG